MVDIKFFIVLAIVVIALGITIYRFVKLTKDEKINSIKEWLKYAVSASEKELGSGTGQLKLRKVYDMAIAKFPWMVTFVSFETFSIWVDEALEWMRGQLENNSAIQSYIEEK